eukprot:364696-Chlamydomonas_euryale.AAC.9
MSAAYDAGRPVRYVAGGGRGSRRGISKGPTLGRDRWPHTFKPSQRQAAWPKGSRRRLLPRTDDVELRVSTHAN